MLYNEISIYRIVKITYLSNYCIERHVHDYFHYIYVIKGNPEIIIRNKIFHAEPRELFLIGPKTEHEVVNKSDKNCETLDIKFSSLNQLLVEKFKCLPIRIENSGNTIESILFAIIAGMYNKEPVINELICIKVLEFLCYLLKTNQTEETRNEYAVSDESIIDIIDNKNIELFEQVKKYIQQNIREKYRISYLANLFNMSEAYFCTMFKKHYDVTPIQYITMLKIEKAVDLMYSTSMNISEISDYLGFETVHYFSRKFKQLMGISPSKYISDRKGNIIINLSTDGSFQKDQHFQYTQKPINR